jgi:heptosyltransferase-2
MIYPGTSETQAYKRYPASHLARLADVLAERSVGSIVIGWGPGEEGIAEDLKRRMTRGAVLAPPSRLTELAELIRECDLFIGSDTGPLHIAAAVGVPLVALYGPTDAAVNAPFTDRPHLSFWGEVTCRPCRNRGCQNRSCLRLIDPDTVATAAMELLSGTRMPGAPPVVPAMTVGVKMADAPHLPDPAGVKKILVRSTNWIGDVVMISPALASLRRRYPHARIEAVAIPQVADLLRGHPAVDDVVLFDRRGRDRGAAGLWRVARELRRRRYDLAVLFQKAIGAALMARLAGVPVRIGLAADRRAWLLTHPVPITPELARRHHLDLFLEVARAAGCDVSDRTPFFPLDQESEAWAGTFLAGKRAGRFAFLVAMHVGASKRPRAWHTDRFARVARETAMRHDAGVVLLGGRSDQEEMARVAAVLEDRAIDASGTTSIRQMAALVKRCRLLIANDSGPMHVAGALGVPVVAIFGPGDPDRTAPAGGPAASVVVSRRYPCAPCRQRFFHECYPAPSGKPMCLESIAVEEVLGAVETALNQVPQSRSHQPIR